MSKDAEQLEEVGIIYKKENLFLKIFLYVVIGVIVFLGGLFSLGMILGFMGVQPPSMDSNIVKNNIERLQNSDNVSDDSTGSSNELELKDEDN